MFVLAMRAHQGACMLRRAQVGGAGFLEAGRPHPPHDTCKQRRRPPSGRGGTAACRLVASLARGQVGHLLANGGAATSDRALHRPAEGQGSAGARSEEYGVGDARGGTVREEEVDSGGYEHQSVV